jgi:hypothetical protein
MPKSPSLEQKDFARAALIESAGRNKVGNFIEVIDEEGDVATFLFENNQKGYVGWRWSVSVYQADANEPATVSEIVLMPGPDSLVAPDWVPWSERLADYKALQLELEKQAALDAAEAEDSDDEAEEGEDEDAEDAEEATDEVVEAEVEEPEDLAVADSEEGQDAEDETKETGRKPPRFFRRGKGLKIKKARGKGKNPKD